MESPWPLWTESPWPDGDQPNCTHRCDKCNQLRFTSADTTPGPHWCRRCRYVNYDEYFGPDGINDLKRKVLGIDLED